MLKNVHQTYIKVKKINKVTIRKSKTEFKRNIVPKSSNNMKMFWSQVRTKVKTKTDVTFLLPEKMDKNSTKFYNKEKVNVLQKQFSGILMKKHFPIKRLN